TEQDVSCFRIQASQDLAGGFDHEGLQLALGGGEVVGASVGKDAFDVGARVHGGADLLDPAGGVLGFGKRTATATVVRDGEVAQQGEAEERFEHVGRPAHLF